MGQSTNRLLNKRYCEGIERGAGYFQLSLAEDTTNNREFYLVVSNNRTIGTISDININVECMPTCYLMDGTKN